jgi:hypothetical protein
MSAPAIDPHADSSNPHAGALPSLGNSLGGVAMATLAQRPFVPASGDERFFLRGAIVITITIIAAFSLQYLMGRSTFASPVRVHLHAFFFMGWVAIYLLQNIFATTGRMQLHRRLGWIAAAWIVPMLVMGCVVTVAMVRLGHVPFFFRPVHFLVFDPLSLFAFAGLTIAAIVMRRRTEWHRRLHFCAMSLLLAPAFGRLLPLPLLQPWGWEASFAAGLLFPLAGVGCVFSRTGAIHPAWLYGIATMVGTLFVIEAVTYSPVGTAIYQAVTAGSPGAAVAPLDFAPPPAGPLVTGRS